LSTANYSFIKNVYFSAYFAAPWFLLLELPHPLSNPSHALECECPACHPSVLAFLGSLSHEGN